MLDLSMVTQVIVDRGDPKSAHGVLQFQEEQCEFADSMLFTASDIESSHKISITPFTSDEEYSEFCLVHIVEFISSSFVLMCHSMGFINNVTAWGPEFLDYDYVGSPDVDGGFSLRSRRLLMFMASCPRLVRSGADDLDIAVHNRAFLEFAGFTFAPPEVSARFCWGSGAEVDAFGTFGRYSLSELADPVDPAEPTVPTTPAIN